MNNKKVAIIGGGAWGTALSAAMERSGCEVLIWAREEEVVDSINVSHENSIFLSGVSLHSSIRATTDLDLAAKQDVLFLVVPSQFLRSTCESLKVSPEVPLIICSKGVAKNSLKLMSEVVEELLPNPVAVLSGPTFADEVAKGLPASVTIACNNKKLGADLGSIIENDTFKVYYSDDVIGAQICGAMKNVLAIASGIIEGSNLGENAKAAVIVRGLAEVRRLSLAKGGKEESVMKLCGLGDLLLTCCSSKSRNTSLGIALGKGESMEDIMKKRRTVAEGVASSESTIALAKQLDIHLPVCEIVNKIVSGSISIEEATQELIKVS